MSISQRTLKDTFVELGLPDLDNAGISQSQGLIVLMLKSFGGSLKTNDNDGAGCPYEPPPSIEDLTASNMASHMQ